MSFTDGDGNRVMKFYPPDPATLNDDITRHLLTLQLRRDISTGRLPATLATYALLGSYVAQSVHGDYEPSLQYIDFLRSYRLAPVPSETLYEKVEEIHKQHRLPATLATYALLGSYVAQSVHGDYEPSLQYIDFLRSYRLAPVPSETLYEKVEEIHKQHRGVTPSEAELHYLENAKKLSIPNLSDCFFLMYHPCSVTGSPLNVTLERGNLICQHCRGVTPSEAELHYLENAKKLSMYGVHLFSAKDGKGVPVQIGVCAHGINVYRDQIRIHRFLWQNIIKIAYRRNVFIVKLEKHESTVTFKLPDHDAAKRVWKCAVEHHTFFRFVATHLLISTFIIVDSAGGEGS
ncbi:unnamed protein product [Gongylonema pulchrum]|uniref:FERM domain-containing protein n=1 Tax=Gongylonema pulchrum TaxID=637853 RepID=A0A3P7MK88_9BILA|nr:unnamed protein product [Gongylonema pulchrum]